jgi:hypothetical protein
MADRRESWVVLVRVTEESDWCVYGPATHREAIDFDRKGIGTVSRSQLANLIPMPKAKTRRE